MCNALRPFLRFFFRHLYHGLAAMYDAFASAVSLGRWYSWTAAVLPYVEGPSILEIGHGTGHVLEALARPGRRVVVGLDESHQMGLLARRRTSNLLAGPPALVRGVAQQLPFASASFNCVVATFPTEYIFSDHTIAEVHRILVSAGRLVVLPVAWLNGANSLERAVAWFFRITGQVPAAPEETTSLQLGRPLEKAGFNVGLHRLELNSGRVVVLVATKVPLVSM